MDLVLSFYVGFYEPGRGLYVDDTGLIAKCAVRLPFTKNNWTSLHRHLDTAS